MNDEIEQIEVSERKHRWMATPPVHASSTSAKCADCDVTTDIGTQVWHGRCPAAVGRAV